MLSNLPSLPIVLVPQSDLSTIERIGLPVVIGVLDDTNSTVRSSNGASTWDVQEVVPRCFGAIASSPSGVAAARTFLAVMAEATGTTELPLCDLTGIRPDEQEATVLRFVVEGFRLLAERNLRRVADLSRSVAALRRVHEQTQSAFRQLEKFVFDNDLAQRTEALALLPGRDMAPLVLTEGETLIQRLPISSAGLSDVGIFVDEVDILDQGELSVALLTKEDSAVRARWTLTDGQLGKGLVRLAMSAALEASSLTPCLEVSWLGSGRIKLCSSIHHPDPRLQPEIGGTRQPQVLAMRCWSFLPGCEAPVTVGAYLPDASDSRPPHFRVIDPAVLANAVDLTPESKHSRYLADQAALLVHPMPRGASIMKLASAIPAGTLHVKARIRTRAKEAPVIEYALAIAPSGGENAGPRIDPTSAAAARTPWVALAPQETGELHLALDRSLDADHDLFLMTQLPVQPGVAAAGWATFDRIRVAFA